MTDLPDAPFAEWTLDDVLAAALGEPLDGGSGRRLCGLRRKLVNAMQEAGARTPADLNPLIRDRHKFAFTLWA